MKKKGLLITLAIIAIASTIAITLPSLLNRAGLHPRYTGERYTLPGKRALIITTSHGILGDTGKKTGVYASEMTVPYYEFLDANMQVDVASIQGGPIPIEPQSLRWPLRTDADNRYLKDIVFKKKVQQSLPVTAIDVTRYDLIFLAGGWGAAYDLGTSDSLGKKISAAYARGVILGAICHGPLGFLKATDTKGKPLVAGRHMTGVTDKQVRELGITITPQHPERELRKAGALFEGKSAFRDIFANHTVVDGSLVTGQNQNAGHEVAQKMMEVFAARQPGFYANKKK